MPSDGPLPPDDESTHVDHARELLALIGQYTAEVAAFSKSLGESDDETDIQARERRMAELRARILALRTRALPKPPAP